MKKSLLVYLLGLSLSSLVLVPTISAQNRDLGTLLSAPDLSVESFAVWQNINPRLGSVGVTFCNRWDTAINDNSVLFSFTFQTEDNISWGGIHTTRTVVLQPQECVNYMIGDTDIAIFDRASLPKIVSGEVQVVSSGDKNTTNNRKSMDEYYFIDGSVSSDPNSEPELGKVYESGIPDGNADFYINSFTLRQTVDLKIDYALLNICNEGEYIDDPSVKIQLNFFDAAGSGYSDLLFMRSLTLAHGQCQDVRITTQEIAAIDNVQLRVKNAVAFVRTRYDRDSENNSLAMTSYSIASSNDVLTQSDKDLIIRKIESIDSSERALWYDRVLNKIDKLLANNRLSEKDKNLLIAIRQFLQDYFAQNPDDIDIRDVLK